MEKSNIIKFPNEDEVRYKEAKDTLDKFYDNSKLKASVALLSPRLHADQPYSERTVIFTDDDAYVKIKRKEGWEAMLRSHYNERVRLDKKPPSIDYSWVRKIVEPIYAKIRRSRKRK